MDCNRNTPVFFKILPATEESRPNAAFLRDMGECAGVPCCEIWFRQEKWIVRYSEALPPPLAMQKTAQKYKAEIDATQFTQTKDIAKALGICVGTLRKRRKFIQNHLGA